MGGAGVAPHEVRGGKEPADYDAFWADLEKRLAAVPVTAERREVPCADKAVRTGAAEVRLRNCEGVQVDEPVRN